MSQLTPLDDAVMHQLPNIIVTDAFLNNPITFTNNIREFNPETRVRQATSHSVISRDEADFAVVDLGATGPQIYVSETFIPVYTRQSYRQIAATGITELT